MGISGVVANTTLAQASWSPPNRQVPPPAHGHVPHSSLSRSNRLGRKSQDQLAGVGSVSVVHVQSRRITCTSDRGHLSRWRVAGGSSSGRFGYWIYLPADRW